MLQLAGFLSNTDRCIVHIVLNAIVYYGKTQLGVRPVSAIGDKAVAQRLGRYIGVVGLLRPPGEGRQLPGIEDRQDRRDADGDYWITGRIDDVINVSGHRIGTAEVESALVLHDSVAEAAVVGYPHDLKGQGVYAFVTTMNGVTPDDTLKAELLALVSKEIGSFAKPELIQWAPALPKTRSGKIMRRILRKIACNELENLGDTSTLADPSVVQGLIDKRLNQ